MLDLLPERSDSGQAVSPLFTGNHTDSDQLSVGAHTSARSRVNGRLVVSQLAMHHMGSGRARARARLLSVVTPQSSEGSSFEASALTNASSRRAFARDDSNSDVSNGNGANGDSSNSKATGRRPASRAVMATGPIAACMIARCVIEGVAIASPAQNAVFETRLSIETNR